MTDVFGPTVLCVDSPRLSCTRSLSYKPVILTYLNWTTN